jgi:hypothetical protein
MKIVPSTCHSTVPGLVTVHSSPLELLICSAVQVMALIENFLLENLKVLADLAD